MKKVLIIEDNHDLADNVALLLTEHGYKTFIAYNGTTALKIYEHETPNIVLCDIMLPDISGYKILKEIKKLENLKSPIFIFLTAKSQRDEIRKGMELGADDYITKPFTYEELIKSITTQIEKREKFEKLGERKITQNKLNKAQQKQKFNFNDYIFINDKKNPGFYPISNILFIKSVKDYTQITLKDNKKFLLRKTMKYWEEKLPDKFIRIHRQTIINLDYVENVKEASSNRLSISLKNTNEKLEVSQRYRKKLKSLLA
ncbi:MAG: response regulator [Melioribacter sp.]|nr:response regulator [Melioribacter sp.]